MREVIMRLIKALDDGQGARWDRLDKQVRLRNWPFGEAEETISDMMDRGELYEPTIGRLALTIQIDEPPLPLLAPQIEANPELWTVRLTGIDQQGLTKIKEVLSKIEYGSVERIPMG